MGVLTELHRPAHIASSGVFVVLGSHFECTSSLLKKGLAGDTYKDAFWEVEERQTAAVDVV